MSDFITLVQNLQREVGVAGVAIPAITGQTGLRNKLVNWIADADEHIQSMHWDWNFLWKQYQQNTVVGNANPPVPADLNVWDRDSFYLDYSTAKHKKLTTLDYRNYLHSQRQGLKSNSKPGQIVIKPDNSLEFVKPADGVYSLTGDYWSKPVRMSANDSVSAIPAAFHRIILVQAKLWYAEEQEIPSVYQAADKELNGDKGKRETGLLSRLESLQLPGQEGRMMGESPDITVRAE